MCSKQLLLFACLILLSGGLRITSTTTTTTFVAAMSIANQDLERYFRSVNSTQPLTPMTEERITMDTFTYAFLNYSYFDNDKIEYSNYDEEKARYGEGKIWSVKGKLVHVTNVDVPSDDTACSSNIAGTRGQPTPPNGTAWIALVKRGRCTFEEKVKNVYEKGAIGVIIYNDKPVNILEKMQIKGKHRNITAVITYQDVGLKMAGIVDDEIDMDCAIIEGRSVMRPINSLNRTSVLFVSISFIVLMVISLIWLIIYYIQRFRYLHTKEQQSRQLCNVTKKAIMKIPTKTGKTSDEKDLDSDCCAICIEAYKPSDCIRVLPCKHEFHKNCIDPWLIEHRTCPMCKLDVLKFYGYVFLGSEESILEYEPDRSGNNTVINAIAAADSTSNAPQRTQMMPTHAGQLADLMRSRDFVIDFPRVFVLEAGSVTGTRDSIFSNRLPERSQSSMSIANATDWMSQVANKLEKQHGLRYFGKSNAKDGMEQSLLPNEMIRKRRSHSADGRYSNGFFARQQMSANMDSDTAAGGHNSRRNSAALHTLTDTSYAQSRRRQFEESADLHTRHRSNSRRTSEIPLRDLTTNAAADSHYGRRTSAVLREAGITIQINGDDVELT